MVKDVVKWGIDKIAPQYGHLVLAGTERLSQSGLRGLAEKITDGALRAVEHAPNSIDQLVGLGESLVEGSIAREKKAKKQEEHDIRRVKARPGYQAIYDSEMAPNHQPNATYVDPRAAYHAPALFPGNRMGQGRGSGMMVYGNDYPYAPIPRPRNNPSQTRGRIVPVLANMNGPNSFGYEGYPPPAFQLPDPRFAVAGPNFEPTSAPKRRKAKAKPEPQELPKPKRKRKAKTPA